MITVYLAKGERLELREAVAVRGETFPGTADAGIVFSDAQGNTLAQFRAAEIAGYVDDVERTRRQIESHREAAPTRANGQAAKSDAKASATKRIAQRA